jgi:hypothetical protein
MMNLHSPVPDEYGLVVKSPAHEDIYALTGKRCLNIDSP